MESIEHPIRPAPAPTTLIDLPRDRVEDLVTCLAHATGADAAMEELRRAAVLAELDGPSQPIAVLTALTRVLSTVGIKARILRGTLTELLDAVGPEHPVATVDPDDGWTVIVERRGRRVRVETAEAEEAHWMHVDALRARLSPDDDGGLFWLAVDPPSPLLARPPSDSAPEEGRPRETSPWARLWALVVRERQDVSVAVIYAAGAGLLALATPLAVQALVNTVAFGTLLQPVLILSVLLLAGLAFAGVLRALQAWVVEILQRRIFLRLVDDLAHRLPRVQASAFDRAHGPELVNRFFDIFTIQKAASSLLINGLEVLLTTAVGMLVLAFYHPFLLLFDAVLVGIVCIILFGFGRGATRTAVRESKAKYEVAGWLEEIARHPKAFKLAGGPGLAEARADELTAVYLDRRKRHFRVVFRQLVGALSLHAFASAGILGIGGFLVVDRQLTLGQLVAAELIVTMVVASFAKIGKHLETAYDLLAALDKVGQLVDLPLEREGRSRFSEDHARGASIVARDLSHAFGDGPRLLDGIDLAVEPGRRIAITGRSGAGLSTLVDLLLGLRRPDAGRVEVDGVDLEDLDRDALRSRVALVRGEEVVAGTIFDNVAFGRRDVDTNRVREAIAAVGLEDCVAGLEGGIEGRLMPGGAPLSRSQALRLVLARAIVGRPALLVIDGALDGLDRHSRELALEMLLSDQAPWTLVTITSSPEVTKRMDCVWTLEGGRLFTHSKEED